ncbi:hypothetical protein AQ742_15540 [Burkholderia pseudomallei]|nr:hypothetical protein AQ742_15540 [Burkholderia pseudomallei]
MRRARLPAALCVLAYASRVPASSSAFATRRRGVPASAGGVPASSAVGAGGPREPAAAPRAGG